MRKLQTNITSVAEMVAEAVEYLRKYEPVRGYWLAFSGGKDSIVSEKLCKLAGVKYRAGFVMTTIDPPEVLSFIRHNYPEVEWFRPEKSFYKLIAEEKMPPLGTARWCCETIKEKPGWEEKKKYPVHIVGIRAEESGRRAKFPRLDMQQTLKAVTIKPIYHWKEYHVWQFIEDYGLKYPNLYDEGFERIGCAICPFMFHKNQGKLNKHRERWPAMYRAFENACRKWYDRKAFTDCPHGSFEAYMEAYYRGFET